MWAADSHGSALGVRHTGRRFHLRTYREHTLYEYNRDHMWSLKTPWWVGDRSDQTSGEVVVIVRWRRCSYGLKTRYGCSGEPSDMGLIGGL